MVVVGVENKSLDIPMSCKFRWSYPRISLHIADILPDLLSVLVLLGLERDGTFILVSTRFTATLELYNKALNRLCQRKSCHYFPGPKVKQSDRLTALIIGQHYDLLLAKQLRR